MDSNKMTGEPNQQNPTSVFGFDTYPPPFPVNWNQNNPFVNLVPQYNTPMNSHQQMFAQDPGLIFSPQVNISSLTSRMQNPTLSPDPSSNNCFDKQLSGFSFGTSKINQDVVHFPFETSTSGFGIRELRCKRKTDSPPMQPVKQHITEEKMAEHMSKLHISSETESPIESDSSRMQRLYMCEEMRKLQTDSILPHSLLSRIQRPCTALVLWKPPTKLVPVLDGNEADQSKKKKSDNNKLDDATNEAEMGEALLNNMDLDTC